MQSTAEALQFSVVRLIKDLAEYGQPAYFWTFTFADAIPPKEAAKRWHNLSRRLFKKYPTLMGVRVFEWHPGRVGEIDEFSGFVFHSHGLHIHLVANLFLSVDEVRKIAKKSGFGRIHVKAITDTSNADRIATYVSKYLRKGLRDRVPCLKGMRLWASWGGFAGTCVKDIVRQTPFSWFWRCVKKYMTDYYPDTLNPLREYMEIKILQNIYCDYRAAFIGTDCGPGPRFYVLTQIRNLFDSFPLHLQKSLAQLVDFEPPVHTVEFFENSS